MSPHVRPEFDAPLRACPMCKSRRIADYDRDFQGVLISRCHDCDLLFMNPQYTDRHLAEYYSHYEPHRAPRERAIAERRRISKTEDLALVERFVRPGRLLSIGCGDGLELEVARQRGWQVEGFEVDCEATRHVAARLNVRVRTGDFFLLRWTPNTYDCVFMDQVLEHPKNPQDYLIAAHRILRPGGVLFIGCPNIESISSRFKGWAGRMGLKRRRRGSHYDTSHHLYYYAPRTLRRIVQAQFGYEVAAVEGDPYNGRKPFVPGARLLDRATLGLRKKFPNLESTFRMICRKPQVDAASPRQAAA